MPPGAGHPERRPSLSDKLHAAINDAPHHAGESLPLARRRTLSDRIFPDQEGLATSTPDSDTITDVPMAPPEPPRRRRSIVQRIRTSMSAGSEHAVADSPEDDFPPAAAIEPGHIESEGAATDTADVREERGSPRRRRMSLSDRLFRSSQSQEDAALDAEGRPRPRRKSISEKFLEAQENEGIPVPSPPSPSPAETPPETQDTPLPRRPESPSPSEAIEPPAARVKSYHPLALEVLVLLMPGSVLGVLARLGLSALDTYDGQGVFALAWVQGIGCLVMGACVGWRNQISAFHPPLYTAIATGFCGSLTTFSSWMLDVFLAFSNGYGYDRIWIYDIMDGLTRTFVTFAVSLCGLSLGLHLASYDLSHNHFIRRLGKIHISRPLRLSLVAISLVIYLLTIPLYFVLSPRFRPLATSALLYSFPGTLMRHVLGTQLNGRHPYYPVGTFLANALGTAFLAIFHAIQRLPSSSPSGPISATSCVVLQGLVDGLCGCLSTVSTFAVEVRGMQGRGRNGRRAWAYAIGSWAAGQILMVAILGGSTWGGGAREVSWCVNRL